MTLQIVASLIDAARGVIYDRYMFIVQATDLCLFLLLCHFLPLSVCFASLCMFLPLSLSLSFYLSLSFSTTLCLFLPLSVYLCLCLPLHVSFYLTLPLSVFSILFFFSFFLLLLLSASFLLSFRSFLNLSVFPSLSFVLVVVSLYHFDCLKKSIKIFFDIFSKREKVAENEWFQNETKFNSFSKLKTEQVLKPGKTL